MNYNFVNPPFFVPFREMTKKQAENFLIWFILERNNRIAILEDFVHLETDKVVFDKSLESLISLWEWFENKIEWVDKTEIEMQKSVEGLPKWARDISLEKDTRRMSNFTKALLYDIGVYFGETFIQHQPSLRWGIKTKPKSSYVVNKPILLGFGKDFDPRHMATVAAVKSTDIKDKNRLYYLYHLWLQWII